MKSAVISQLCCHVSLSKLLALSACGLSFPICQVDMSSYTSLNQRGTNELAWAMQPIKED